MDLQTLSEFVTRLLTIHPIAIIVSALIAFIVTFHNGHRLKIRANITQGFALLFIGLTYTIIYFSWGDHSIRQGLLRFSIFWLIFSIFINQWSYNGRE